MRLTLTIGSLGPGGAEHVLSLMANDWAAKEIDITLITMDDAIRKPFFPLDERITLVPLGISISASFTPANIFVQLWKNIDALRRLRNTLHISRPDCVISFIEKMNVLTLLASKGLGIPIIVAERTNPRMYPNSRVWSILRRITYPWAKYVVVQTNGVQMAYPVGIRKRSIVIPNPVPAPSAYQPEERLDDPLLPATIVSIGRLEFAKGHDLLIRAFASIAYQYPDWRIEIWGEGVARQELEELIRKLKLENRVFLPGLTRDSSAVLRNAKLFVLPSRYEGFPNVLCEAMAHGLPVISYACDYGPSEIIQHSVDGILVPPEDISGLADAMRQLIESPQERRRLANAATHLPQRFHFDDILAQWEAILPCDNI
ncbi:MAG: glycosyltransferase family 4 protein [Caldilineaceae bacterium]